MKVCVKGWSKESKKKLGNDTSVVDCWRTTQQSLVRKGRRQRQDRSVLLNTATHVIPIVLRPRRYTVLNFQCYYSVTMPVVPGLGAVPGSEP
jgi:hypothetical protein